MSNYIYSYSENMGKLLEDSKERIAQLEAEVERLESAIADYEAVLAAVSYGDMDLKEAILNEMSSRPSFKLQGGGRESGGESASSQQRKELAGKAAAEPATYLCKACGGTMGPYHAECFAVAARKERDG